MFLLIFQKYSERDLVMEQLNILSNFLNAVSGDPRIGASHISLYCAFLQCGVFQQGFNPVMIRSSEAMKIAKISGLATYYKCLKDLHDQGYIRYQACYNHRKMSKVYLLS